MVSKNTTVCLIIIALVLSATAVYLAITDLSEAPISNQPGIKGQVGVYVRAVDGLNTRMEPEKEEGTK